MKRRATLPHPKERVYEALTDPILLAGWLNIPYASTGHGELHLFELEDWRQPDPWKVRGFIVENERHESLTIEKDEIGSHQKPILRIDLSETAEGCSIDLEWTDPHFDRTAREFLNPEGHHRLRLLIKTEAARATPSAG